MGRKILHLFYSPIQTETRLFKEAAFTLRHGIADEVVVIGIARDGLAQRETTSDGLQVYRVRPRFASWPLVRRASKFPLFRKFVTVISLIHFHLAVLRYSATERPNYVSCHNAALLGLCVAAARFADAHTVYLPHELETERSHLHGVRKFLESWVERKFISKARDVVVVCDPIKAWYEQRYGLRNVHVVRNTPERIATKLRELPNGGLRERFKVPESATIFIYQGLFGEARGVPHLLKVFAGQDPATKHLVLMGYGSTTDEDEVRAFSANHPNIHFLPAVPRELIVSYSSGADVGVFLAEKPGLSYRYSLPNKFFEYIHAGLPVLVSDNLDYLRTLVSSNGLGWVTGWHDAAALIAAIDRLMVNEKRPSVFAHGRDAVWESDAEAFRVVYR
jgi:glycosyltransferase involved in cell wall biosynthesis